MRPALLALLPMLAAAAFVLLGGERLAREQVEEPIPADRERLLTFTEALEKELKRLENLYLSHLERLAGLSGPDAPPDLEEQARGFTSLRALHFLTLEKERGRLKLLPVGSRERLPEIVFEGHDRPFKPRDAVILGKELLLSEPAGSRGWILAPNSDHRVYWTRPTIDRLVVCVVSWSDLHAQLREHLSEWMAGPLTPLREAGERMEVHGPLGESLALTGDEERGPAALLMPLRTSLGDWQLRAWDGMTVTTQHNTATLTMAGTLAAVLVLGGLFLFVQQRRALALAEERVSFVNRVSHELGNPLTNVALNLDLAAEAVEITPSEARQRLGIATEEIARLARLVANVLTFSRRERRTLEIDPRPCTPDEVIAKTLDSFRPSLGRRGIELEWEAQATERVHLDPDALEQIVGNLISNVEKYAAEGRWLGLRSGIKNEQLTVTVEDRGSGILPANRDQIFKAFERVHRKVNEGSSGTGLGLTIARELAARMGGSLELLESEEGTHFELRLPAPAVLAVVPDDKTSAA